MCEFEKPSANSRSELEGRRLDPVLRKEFEDVVPHEHAALKALHPDLPVNVLRHVRDDPLLALAEFLHRRLRALLASLSAWLREA
jgi:hypothetical protein